jgi:hypothetical protein
MIRRLDLQKVVVKRGFTTHCFEWPGDRGRKGYGTVSYKSKPVRVHRLAWMLWKGPIPHGIEVAHKCDNPACYNLDHLFLATHLENMRDAAKKGRIVAKKGEAHSQAKLKEADVLEIRRRYVPRTNSRHVLAKEFGVSSDLIWLIGARRIWKHI